MTAETPEQAKRRRDRQRRNSAAYRKRNLERARESRRLCDMKRRRAKGVKPRGPYKPRTVEPKPSVVLNERMLAVKERLLALRRGET